MEKAKLTLVLLAFYCSSTIAIDVCEEQENGVRLAHPADCSKYIVCDQQETSAISTCPPGLHFNRQLRECDLKARAGCQMPTLALADTCDCATCCSLCDCNAGGVTPIPTLPTPDTPSNPTASPPTSNTPAVPETPSSPTPAVTDTPTLPTPSTPTGSGCSNNLTVCVGKPDNSSQLYEGNCNQYVVCLAGCGTVMTCPNNLQFNANQTICDYPENVNCPWQSTPPSTGPSGTSCAQPGKCAGQAEGSTFSDTSSNGYIVCQCECEIPMPCPAGLVFNDTAKVCDWPAGYGSGGGAVDGGGSTGGSGGGAVDGDGSAGSTGGTGTNVNVTCSNDSTLCKSQPEGTLFPVNGVCNQFYKCNYGCAVEINCPNNLVYNSDDQYCDYPQNFNCPWPYTPPSGPSAGPSGIACPSGGRCVGEKEGTFFPSTASCGKYVVCQCECEVEMSCPPGLYFDVLNEVCNYPTAVDCTE